MPTKEQIEQRWLNQYGRSVECGWLGKVVAVELMGDTLMLKMVGVDELYNAIAGGSIESALCEDDVQWFTPGDVRRVKLVWEDDRGRST